MDKMTISVCMASYNGEQYIADQIESIIDQLDEGDELLISDDGSNDNTIDIVRQYIARDARIRLTEGPKKGYACNFGHAMESAKGDILVLTDQDDLWGEGKIKLIREAFQEVQGLTTILHDMSTFRDDKLRDTHEISIVYHSGALRNYIKSCYWGCCMAIKATFIRQFLPLREYCSGHDLLLGLLSESYGKTLFLDKKLIWHRLHDKNTSHRKTIREMIENRIKLARDFRFAIRISKANGKA